LSRAVPSTLSNIVCRLVRRTFPSSILRAHPIVKNGGGRRTGKVLDRHTRRTIWTCSSCVICGRSVPTTGSRDASPQAGRRSGDGRVERAFPPGKAESSKADAKTETNGTHDAAKGCASSYRCKLRSKKDMKAETNKARETTKNVYPQIPDRDSESKKRLRENRTTNTLQRRRCTLFRAVLLEGSLLGLGVPSRKCSDRVLHPGVLALRLGFSPALAGSGARGLGFCVYHFGFKPSASPCPSPRTCCLS